MASGPGQPALSAMAALIAAFLWATYYLFVLSLHASTLPAAVLVYPFLFGGLAYLAFALLRGHGRAFLAVWRDPWGWVRMGLLFGMQAGVVAATYTAGAVDTSLLSLVGDVALTPIILMVLYHEATDRARSAVFWLGLVLACGGAALTILGGQSAPALSGVAWLVAPAVPVLVAFYFLLSAKANQRTPMTAIIAQSTLGAAFLGVLASPLLPGGAGGLWVPDPVDVALLAVLGVTSFFLGPYLYFRAIELAGLLLPALLMSSIPVFTLAISVVAFGTSPVLLGLAGIPIAVVGSVLALRGSHPGWAPEYDAPAGAAAK